MTESIVSVAAGIERVIVIEFVANNWKPIVHISHVCVTVKGSYFTDLPAIDHYPYVTDVTISK